MGHVDGQTSTHLTLSGCPDYHNCSLDKWIEMCAREEGIVPQNLNESNKFACNSPMKIAKNFMESSQQFKTFLREPLLDDLANQVEIYQFRRAQQRLVSSKVCFWCFIPNYIILCVF